MSLNINTNNCAGGDIYTSPSCELIVFSPEQMICKSAGVESLTDNGDEFDW